MSASIANQLPVIQEVINQGRGIGASIIGQPFTWFRATSAAFPMAQGNNLGTIMSVMDPDFRPKFNRPALYGKPIYEAILDPTNTLVGDYLVGVDGATYFIADQESLLPIAVIRCNRVINVLRPTAQTTQRTVGAQPYSGDIEANETPVMEGWPASVLTKTRGEIGPVGLPGDIKLPWSEVLVPYCGAELLFADVITDDNGLRYLIGTTERTNLGWRLMVVQQTA
jgi:hypothetical protein